jgi:hypothetical protein
MCCFLHSALVFYEHLNGVWIQTFSQVYRNLKVWLHCSKLCEEYSVQLATVFALKVYCVSD